MNTSMVSQRLLLSFLLCFISASLAIASHKKYTHSWTLLSPGSNLTQFASISNPVSSGSSTTPSTPFVSPTITVPTTPHSKPVARIFNITALCTLHQLDIDVQQCSAVRYENAILCIAYGYAIKLANQQLHRTFGQGLRFQPHLISCCDNLDSLDSSGYEVSAPLIRQSPNLCDPIIDNYVSGSDDDGASCDLWRRHAPLTPTILTGIMPSSLALLEVTVLGDYCIPVLPTLADSERLDDYDNFVRISPSTEHQANAIFEILSFLNWTAISIVCDNSIYGIDLLNVLRKNINSTQDASNRICIDQVIQTAVDANTAYEVPSLQLEQSRAKVLVVLMNEFPASVFLQRMNEIAPSRLAQFQIIGCDASMREIFGLPHWTAMTGSITLQMYRSDEGVSDFQHYLTHLPIADAASSTNGDQFEQLLGQIIAQQNDCQFGNASGGSRPCLGNETFDTHNASWIFNSIPAVLTSVSAINRAFQRLSQQLCGSGSGNKTFCDHFWKTVTGKTLIEAMRQVLNDSDSADILAWYKVYKHIHGENNKDVALKVVGQIRYFANGTTDIDLDAGRLMEGISDQKLSSIQYHQTECHSCLQTQIYAYAGCCQFCKGDPKICDDPYAYCDSDGHCQLCPRGTVYSSAVPNGHPCVSGTVSSKNLHLNTIFIIWGASGVGLLLTFIAGIVVVLYRNTPIVIVSKRPMLAVIFLTTLGYFALPLGTFAEFDYVMCSGFWFTLGLAMTASGAATIAKLHMYSRAVKMQEQQFTMATVIGSIITMCYVEILIGFATFIYRFPALDLLAMTTDGESKYVSVCNWFDGVSSILLLFPMSLQAFSVLTCLRNTKVSIRFINHEVRNTLICTILQLVAAITIGPAMTFGIYNTLQQNRFIIFLSYVEIYGYLQLVFLIGPTFYLIIFQRNKNRVDWLLGQKLPTVTVENETYVVQINRIKSFADAMPYPVVMRKRQHLDSESRSRKSDNTSNSNTNNHERPSFQSTMIFSVHDDYKRITTESYA